MTLLVCKISAEKSLIALQGFLVWNKLFFSRYFKILSLFLTCSLFSLFLTILIIMCLGVDLFGFISFRNFWASCTWISVTPPRLGSFWQIRFLPFSFSLLLLGPLYYKCLLDVILEVSQVILIFFKFPFLSAALSG